MADISAFNPFELKRPEPVQETKTFTDPAFPDKPFDITLKTLVGQSAMADAYIAQEKLVNDFAIGENGEIRGPLPIPGNGVFAPSAVVVRQCAIIMSMQVVPEGLQKPDLRFWVWISEVMPTAFQDVARFANDLSLQASGELKNG